MAKAKTVMEVIEELLKTPDPSNANIVTGGMRTFSDDSQKYLDRVLNKSKLMDLPKDAELQGFQSNVFHHGGVKGIESYDLDAPKLNAGSTPEGLYTGVTQQKGGVYLDQAKRKGKEAEIYDLVSNAEKVFVMGSDKPNQAMIDAYRKHLEDRFGGDTGYISQKLDQFIEGGWIPTDMSRKAKSDIYRAGGADALLDGEDIVFLDPSMTRRTDAAFDPMRMGENNWLAGAAPVAAGGILAALGGNDAQASEYRPTDKSVADLAQRTIRQSYDPLPSVGSIEGVPNNPVSQGANTAAFKMDRLNRNLQNAGILSLLAPESTPDVLGRAAYGESRWYDPALVLLDFL